MKLTKTYYTCDLCGWTVENETELVSHTIPVSEVSRRFSGARIVDYKVDLCRRCLDKVVVVETDEGAQPTKPGMAMLRMRRRDDPHERS